MKYGHLKLSRIFDLPAQSGKIFKTAAEKQNSCNPIVAIDPDDIDKLMLWDADVEFDGTLLTVSGGTGPSGGMAKVTVTFDRNLTIVLTKVESRSWIPQTSDLPAYLESVKTQAAELKLHDIDVELTESDVNYLNAMFDTGMLITFEN